MKKIICLLMVVCISGMCLTAFSEGLSESQINELRDKKIMIGDTDGNMHFDDNITRAEAAKIVCSIQNYHSDGLAADLEESLFPDVWDAHWAKWYINIAKRLQIIEGDENGNFNPEDNVTNEEIVKMLVSVLGYAPFAEQNGGFPAGFLRASTRIGLTDGLMLDVNSPAKRGDVAVMLINALDIPLMVQTKWSVGGECEYTIFDGKTNVFKSLRTEIFGESVTLEE